MALLDVTMDSVNEKGVAISVLELTRHATLQDTAKPDILSITIIRPVLERCASVDEAVQMFHSIDMCNMPTDFNSHDIIDSNDQEYQVCTNHYLTTMFTNKNDGISHSLKRYETASNILAEGPVSEEEATSILSDVSVHDVVYPEHENWIMTAQ